MRNPFRSYQQTLNADQRARVWRRKWADPTTIRQWHNPADPAQARRIEAAAAKRARRAETARDQAGRAWMSNYAHHRAFAQIHDETQVICPLSLNPFYVAK